MLLFLIVPVLQLRGQQDSSIINSPIAPDSIKIKYLDSLIISVHGAKNAVFYDSLKQKSLKRQTTKFLYNTLFISPRSTTPNPNAGYISNESIKSLRKEGGDFKEFAGKTIASVNILNLNIYDDAENNTWIKRTTNNLNSVTRKWVIRGNLMFKQGQKLSPTTIINNEVYLRNLPYISQANILVLDSDMSPGEVDIYVVTRDKWSISAGAKYSSKRFMGEVYDKNVFGTGSRLALRTYLGGTGNFYGGNQVQFDTPNIYGTFIKFRTTIGKGFEEKIATFAFDKEFINPGDYALGASYGYHRYAYGYMTRDTSQMISNTELNLWLGKSFKIDSDGQALFVSAGYRHEANHERPEVSAEKNTGFYNDQISLLSLGYYKENFYHGRFIYGYGREEDIPFGYHFDVTGGHYFGEFDNKIYLGATASGGGRTDFGYLRASMSWGTLLRNKSISRTVFLAHFSGFSNLLSAGENYFVRQFLDLDLTMGFHRLEGEGERVNINGYYRPRGMLYDKSVFGRNRLILKNETVVFTPLFVYGFRFSFFGFCDFAWIGERNALFTNDYFVSAGFGVRLKNERFIFDNIELRFSIVLRKEGLARGEWVGLGKEPRIVPYVFRPSQPMMLPYN